MRFISECFILKIFLINNPCPVKKVGLLLQSLMHISSLRSQKRKQELEVRFFHCSSVLPADSQHWNRSWLSTWPHKSSFSTAVLDYLLLSNLTLKGSWCNIALPPFFCFVFFFLKPGYMTPPSFPVFICTEGSLLWKGKFFWKQDSYRNISLHAIKEYYSKLF